MTRPAVQTPLRAGHNTQVVQPRRVAAKAAARRMAALLGERVGARIGFATRLERALSGATRIEVVTTGVLLRRLQMVCARMHARILTWHAVSRQHAWQQCSWQLLSHAAGSS